MQTRFIRSFFGVLCGVVTLTMHAMETDPLLKRNKKPSHIIVTRPRLTKCQKFGLLAEVLGPLTLEVGGGLWLGLGAYTHMGIVGGPMFIAGGVGFHCLTAWHLWKKYRKEPAQLQFVAQANNQLEQTVGTIRRKKLTIPHEHIETLRSLIVQQDSAQIKDMITNIDVLSIEPQINLTQREITQQTHKLTTLLICLQRKGLPRDLRYKIVAQRPELIHNQQMFNLTLLHAWNDGQLATWLHKFPLQWFNGYYRLKCGKEYKVDFSRTVAHAATNIRMNILLAFLPHEIREQFTQAELREMQECIFNQYKNKITYEPVPEV